MKGKLLIYFSLVVIFLVGGLFTSYLAFKRNSDQALVEDIAVSVGKELQKVNRDLEELSLHPENADPESKFAYPVFIYQGPRLVFWSDNSFVPPAHYVFENFDITLFTTGSESYLVKRKALSDGTILLGAIRLLRKYPITNDYFKTEFNPRILPFPEIQIREPNDAGGFPVCLGEKCLFRVVFLERKVADDDPVRIASFVLIGLAILFLILLLYALLSRVARKNGELGFLFLFVTLAGLRITMIMSGFPSDFMPSPLFDHQVFAVSALNASLGDLFLNLLIVLALAFFVFRNYFRFRLHRLKSHSLGPWAMGIFFGLVILFSGLFPVVVIQTLYNNSSIVLDISQSLRFDLLRLVALVCVLISALCAFLFLHVFTRMLIAIGSGTRVFICMVTAVLIFTVVNSLTGQQFVPTLITISLYVLVLYFTSLYKNLKRLNFGTFGYLFIAILFLSINAAFTIQFFTQKEKTESHFRFASNFLIDRDIFAEYLLNEAAQKISADAFIESRIASPFLGKDAIRQKIRQVYLASYFNKYDITIHIFNSVGDPVDAGTVPLSEFLTRYNADAYRTQFDGIRFIDNPASDVAQKYLVIIPLTRGGVTGSHIIIELALKKIIPENVYPELLVDYSYQQFYRTQDLSYAVYSNGKPVLTSGEFNYERLFPARLFEARDLYLSGISWSGFFHIAVEDKSGRTAIVSSRLTPFTHRFVNFSFLLTLGLLIVLVMVFVQGVYDYFEGGRLFFSARIQLYLNLAFFIPLIIVSVSTLGLTSRSSQQQVNDEYLSKSRVFGRQMTDFLDEDASSNIDDVQSLGNRLGNLAKLSNLDANIYDLSGRLMVSSQPLIFERNLLSPVINPVAFHRVRNGEILFVESEQVGNLEYFVSYAVLKSPKSGKLLGILGIPFFQSAYLLEKVQSVILINILNIFALIFIILLILSYVVAERLTFPLRFITQSLRKTSLTKVNTPLTWPSDDEIGLMVREYNAMLFKLSESKSELEQTQREKAWREIAQQVAHEIKNPLTPMKLTLQQLERSLQSGNGSDEKVRKAVAILLTQVDTLNEIASSFSGFVRMPELSMQPLEIVAVLKRVVDLHSPTGEIRFRPSLKEVWISGDLQLLSRTFSNVILNALQAGKPGHPISVEVFVEVVNSYCRITFRDNGRGIPPEIADRVFLPNFSTKKSGSGLGLAIARQGIEQMKGRIWFESTPGEGATFFIELPVLSKPS